MYLSSLLCPPPFFCCVQPVMLFGGGTGAKPAEGGGGDKKDGGFNMGNMMEGLKKANEIGQKTKDLQKVRERVTATR